MDVKGTRGIPLLKNVLDAAAGLVGLFFDRFNGTHPESQAETTAWDDLTIISGIGPAFARRLNQAGITTFVQLAALSVDELREKAGLSVWQGEPEAWIAQARVLI